MGIHLTVEIEMKSERPILNEFEPTGCGLVASHRARERDHRAYTMDLKRLVHESTPIATLVMLFFAQWVDRVAYEYAVPASSD